MKSLPLASALLLVISTIAHAGTAEGLVALEAKDYVTARKEFESAAKKGDPEAHYQLALFYITYDLGVQPDMLRAASYFKNAAKRGHVAAARMYGYLNRAGEGVSRSDIEAFGWFSYAAKNGDAKSREELDTYFKGRSEKWHAKADRRALEIAADIKRQLAQDEVAKATGKPVVK